MTFCLFRNSLILLDFLVFFIFFWFFHFQKSFWENHFIDWCKMEWLHIANSIKVAKCFLPGNQRKYIQLDETQFHYCMSKSYKDFTFALFDWLIVWSFNFLFFEHRQTGEPCVCSSSYTSRGVLTLAVWILYYHYLGGGRCHNTFHIPFLGGLDWLWSSLHLYNSQDTSYLLSYF